jgi:hypothetical protein
VAIAAAQGDQDSIETGRPARQFQPDGRRALAGLDVEAVLDQPDAAPLRDTHGPFRELGPLSVLHTMRDAGYLLR